jgi:flagellin-like protein
MTSKKSMKKDEQAVSPVIAVIMLIAITVVIAAIVAAFAYGIIGGVRKAPSCALVVEGAISGFDNTTVKIIHHGGDKVIDAFDNSLTAEDPWGTLEVRYNGATVDNATYPVKVNNNSTISDPDFKAGDEITIEFAELFPGESITIVYTPTENVIQRITVA